MQTIYYAILVEILNQVWCHQTEKLDRAKMRVGQRSGEIKEYFSCRCHQQKPQRTCSFVHGPMVPSARFDLFWAWTFVATHRCHLVKEYDKISRVFRHGQPRAVWNQSQPLVERSPSREWFSEHLVRRESKSCFLDIVLKLVVKMLSMKPWRKIKRVEACGHEKYAREECI